MMELAGKTAMVAGATGGMGREIALALAGEGVGLILLGRSKSRLKNLSFQLKHEINVPVRIVYLNLEGEIEKEAEEISLAVGPVDILVYAAGSIVPNFLKQVSKDEYERQFNINFQSTYFLVKAMIPGLKDRKGQIVMINSSIIKNSKADLSVYTASKYALAGFTESLRQEVNPFGVRVINIIPGNTATSMLENLTKNKGEAYDVDKMIQPYDIACSVLHVLKLPLTAEITDLYIRAMRK